MNRWLWGRAPEDHRGCGGGAPALALAAANAAAVRPRFRPGARGGLAARGGVMGLLRECAGGGHCGGCGKKRLCGGGAAGGRGGAGGLWIVEEPVAVGLLTTWQCSRHSSFQSMRFRIHLSSRCAERMNVILVSRGPSSFRRTPCSQASQPPRQAEQLRQPHSALDALIALVPLALGADLLEPHVLSSRARARERERERERKRVCSPPA